MAAKEQAVLEVSVTGVDKAASQFNSFQQTTTKTMSSSEAAVARSLKNMVSQFVGVAAAARAVKNVVSSGIGFNQFVENTTTSFTVMMKSAEKAKAQMKDLYDFAVNSPLTFKETAASSKQLMAYGFAAEELVPTMRTLGSVAIATGHSLDDISYVYGTLKSQGRAYSRDLMQFGMRGIPIYEELAKVMGVDVKQIQKMASEGKIGFAEVEQAFQNMTTGSGRFSGVIEGYMTTLTGKLSMLGDIAQQSAGNLMSGVTDQLKDFVDSMTKALSSKGTQSFIDDMSGVLGTLAAILGGVITALVTILPIIGKIMKALIPAAAVLLFLKTLTMLPAILMAIGAAATTAATGLTTAASAMTVGAAASSAMAFGTASAASGISALSASLVAFATANPWLLALIGIAAVGGAVITILSGVADEARKSTNENVRAKQLEKDFEQVDVQGPNAGSTRPAWLKASEVQKLAEEYKLAEGTTARILINAGALSASTWQQYLNTKSVTLALQEQDKVAKGLKHTSLTIEQEQAKYFAGITGYSVDRYYDPDDTTAFGRRAANDYIAAVQATTQQQKDLLGSAFMPEDSKKLLENELKSVTDKLQATLSSGLGMADLEKSGYLQGLREYIEKLQIELGGFGKKAKELKHIDLGKWWAPLIKAASLTVSAYDDIDIATAQAQESATKEYEQRRKAYTEELKITDAQVDRVAIIQKRNELEALYLQYQKDITAEGIKQKNIASYGSATEGSEAYWNNMKASSGMKYQNAADISDVSGFYAGNVGTALSSGDWSSLIPDVANAIKYGFESIKASGASEQFQAQMLQGTEVGNVQSGGMGIAGVVGQAVTAFASMISSIENVGKVLNPFQTIFESAKEILEPLFNNALKPIVQILEQVGTVLGQMLAPSAGILKILSVLVYVALVPFMTVLQLVGSAFEWLYNSVIVPAGNAFIGLVNAVIGAINGALGWLGVNIQYIDQLETTTAALADFSDAIANQTEALNTTIDYLTDKINNAVDKQVDSLQDLYEVGAISGADYEKQVGALNAQKIATENLGVSAEDRALTGEQMYARLYELYGIKDAIENDDSLTEEQVSKILTDAGLTDTSEAILLKGATLAGLKGYGGATGTDISTLTKTLTEANAAGVTQLIAAYNGTKTTHPQTTGPKTETVHTSSSSVAGVTSSVLKAAAQVKVASLQKQYDSLKSAGADYRAIDTVRQQLDKAKAQLASYAVGTSSVPYDMYANIHKGEGIVPTTFMDSIRSGELTLSGNGNEGSGQTIVVNVNVAGSVQTENDLVNTISSAIYRQRSKNVALI